VFAVAPHLGGSGACHHRPGCGHIVQELLRNAVAVGARQRRHGHRGKPSRQFGEGIRQDRDSIRDGELLREPPAAAIIARERQDQPQ
jgi:hypothetical protein